MYDEALSTYTLMARNKQYQGLHTYGCTVRVNMGAIYFDQKRYPQVSLTMQKKRLVWVDGHLHAVTSAVQGR